MAADMSTRDAIDDVFDDGFSDLDDNFQDDPTLKAQRDDKPTLSPRAPKRKAGEDGDAFGLGLDEEVKIAKKRAPIAKLDEARLLSEPGIPKLRTLVRSKQLSRKLRLKGKGHEFNDAAKLLNYFQLWLDDLYPRAKFADALSMAEKAGHTKRMQMTRCEWINEGKPGYMAPIVFEPDKTRGDLDLFESNAVRNVGVHNEKTNAARSNELSDDGVHDDSLFIPDANHIMDEEKHHDPDDDELEALLAEENAATALRQPTNQILRQEDSEGEDDLDAFLAEQDARHAKPITNTITHKKNEDRPEEEEYDDDLDALFAEQETRVQSKNHNQVDRTTMNQAEVDMSHDLYQDDVQLPPAMPLSTEQESHQNYANPSPEELVKENFLSSSPLPNDDMIDDDTPGDVTAEPRIEDSAVSHDQDAEVPIHIDDANHASTVRQGELDEDYLSSSPIDLS